MTDRILTRRGEPDLTPALPLITLLFLLGAACVGALLAVYALPNWLPGLAASLLGPEPKAYWYLSRASALAAYGLLWLSMLFGVTLTSRVARVWPGGPTAFDLHQHTGLLGLALALFHGLILMGDKYIGYSLAQVLVPFSTTAYRPFGVGLGQVAFYLMALVGLTFYVQRTITTRLWRLIHFLSFAVFALALVHGLISGTDTATPWAIFMYWGSAASLLFLTLFRLLSRALPIRA